MVEIGMLTSALAMVVVAAVAGTLMVVTVEVHLLISSAKSVINMVMRLLTVIIGTMIIMFLVSLWIIPISILIKINLRPLLTPIRTSTKVRIITLIPIRHSSLISLSTISTLLCVLLKQI